MTPRELQRILSEHRTELDRLGVASLAVFGSVARQTATDETDVDLLVEFSGPAGAFELLDAQEYLQSITGLPVDLTTQGALHPEMQGQILTEAVRVA